MNHTTNKSRRISKTIAEMTIGIIGILAIMLAQIGSKSNSDSQLGNFSSSPSVKLVSVMSEDLASKVVPVTGKINWFRLLY